MVSPVTICLIALGSNLGDREATLTAAVEAIGTSTDVRLLSTSRWRWTAPVGGCGPQPKFLNGAALLETSSSAAQLQTVLQRIETQFGRDRRQRWAERTLDLDMLLYGDDTISTPSLTVPHPRMSFRRFVLEPSVEIAGSLIHPTIGWPLEKLLRHLETGADVVAIVGPYAPARDDLVAMLTERCGGRLVGPHIDDARRWPTELTSWLTLSESTSTNLPKLTILLDPPTSNDVAWLNLAQLAGRGPTLRIPSGSEDTVEREAIAAVEAVWPRLGPLGRKRLQ
jgi:2-amino-4-hydroxy-6-hydroxymethyldihydropteridine diphosphokinase